MGQLSFKNISPLTETRILRFFNGAFRPSDLMRALANRPHEAGDYGIGTTVAKRIIDAKRAQPTRRFQQLSDLNGIKGFGQDKFNDIAKMFTNSTAEKFKTGLYNGTLYDNFPVRYHAITFADEAAFLDTVNDPSKIRAAIQAAIPQFAAQGTSPSDLDAAKQQVADGYLDFHEDAHLGSFAFGLWFYHFDMDNWFSFDKIRLETEEFLTEVHNTRSNKVFALLKGFNHKLIGQKGIISEDLPIVFSQEELSIYLWTAQLFD